MWLAGIPVADKTVLWLAASLREAELVDNPAGGERQSLLIASQRRG